MNIDKMTQEKFMMSVPESMYRFIEDEMSRRGLDSVQETVRQIISQKMVATGEKAK